MLRALRGAFCLLMQIVEKSDDAFWQLYCLPVLSTPGEGKSLGFLGFTTSGLKDRLGVAKNSLDYCPSIFKILNIQNFVAKQL